MGEEHDPAISGDRNVIQKAAMKKTTQQKFSACGL
jgi:hypothetical protein